MGTHGKRSGQSFLCPIDNLSVRLVVIAILDLIVSSTALVLLVKKLSKLLIIDEVLMRGPIGPIQEGCLKGYRDRLGDKF